MSSPNSDDQLLSLLIEIKNDLSTQIQALTKRMSHIDEQISQICNFLPLLNASVTNKRQPTPIKVPSSPLPQISSSLSTTALLELPKTVSSETDLSSVPRTPSFEAPSFYSEINPKLSSVDKDQELSTAIDVHYLPRQSKVNEQLPLLGQRNDNDAGTLPIPSSAPSSSIYNHSVRSSIASLGASATSRTSISNKIAPAPSSPVTSKHPLSTTFQPISNVRYNPGHSPKPKTRSHRTRTYNKYKQQSPEKSTIIELESSTERDFLTGKSVSSLSTSTTKSNSSVFRRFLTSGNKIQKATTASSTRLYSRTSDEDHPISPTSSGNDDDGDNNQLLTSISSKHHHQTLL